MSAAMADFSSPIATRAAIAPSREADGLDDCVAAGDGWAILDSRSMTDGLLYRESADATACRKLLESTASNSTSGSSKGGRRTLDSAMAWQMASCAAGSPERR